MSRVKLPAALSRDVETPEQTISRGGFGGGVGGLVGYLMGGWPGAAIGAASGLALAAMSEPETPRGVLTPERKQRFEQAIETIESPAALRRLADAFEAEELPLYAKTLRAKADSKKLTPEQVKFRHEFFMRCLASRKIDSIRIAAANFKAEGALGAAHGLDVHIADLEAIRDNRVTPKVVDHFTQKLSLMRETFPEESKEVQSALSNLRACQGPEPETPPGVPPPGSPPRP